MKNIFITLLTLSTLFCLPILSSAQELSTPKLKYNDNQSKSFIGEDEFYSTLDKEIYQEYENAAFSLRQKIAFKDVPDSQYVFNVKTNHYREKMDLQNQTDIHPNRQVYFMASFYQTDKEEHHKFAVIDAETKELLLGGSSYHHYDNPYK